MVKHSLEFIVLKAQQVHTEAAIRVLEHCTFEEKVEEYAK
jgi:hypothetical protein